MAAATTSVSVEDYLNTSFPDGDREYVDGQIVERNMGDIDHADAQSFALWYFRLHYPQYWSGVAVRVQVKPTRYRVPDVSLVLGPKPEGRVLLTPPFLVVEVLSQDDRADEIEEKIQDYLSFGVNYVWVLNPRTRRAWVHTSESIREAKDGWLRTADPVIELPLAEMFRQ